MASGISIGDETRYSTSSSTSMSTAGGGTGIGVGLPALEAGDSQDGLAEASDIGGRGLRECSLPLLSLFFYEGRDAPGGASGGRCFSASRRTPVLGAPTYHLLRSIPSILPGTGACALVQRTGA